MDVTAVLKEGLFGSLSSVFDIAKVVIPLMIAMQIARDYHVLDYLSKFMKPVTHFLGMSKESGFPLMVGLVFGLAYGAGVIVQSAKEGNLTHRDMVLLSVFLASCHAVFEDVVIFVAIGANGWLILASRILAGVLVTYAVSKRLDRSNAYDEILPQTEK